VSSADDGKNYEVTGWLHRGDEKRSITLARALTANLVFWEGSLRPSWKRLRECKHG